MKCKVIIALSLITLSVRGQQNNENAWTWFYRKLLDNKIINKHSNEIMFTQTDIPHFLQLIFSWNGFRPQKGYYSFWVKVRDAKTKIWSDWYKMSEWGSTIQRSFHTKTSDGIEFAHVRLETKKKGVSDAFAIKAHAHGGACLANLKAFMVNTSDNSKFKSELGGNDLNKLGSLRIKNVPIFSQFELDHPRNDGLCSPTSCSMITSYFIKSLVDPIIFAEKSYDHGLEKYGSWPFNMAHAFECCKGAWWFAVVRLQSFSHLCRYLKSGIPVAVSVRGPLPGAFGQYANGHLLVVTGYDAQKKEVICNDPAAKSKGEVNKRYCLQDFLQSWEKSHRLAYVADRNKHT
ncbi:MAG: C39 family peptidase [Candidatus Dependentiae bacterium]